MPETSIAHWEELLRTAARAHRRVRIRFEYAGARETEYEREYEPYGIEDGSLIAFSYYRDEFRHIELDRILDVEILDATFEPRRPIDA